jgi:DnaD/phage-associated family protein
MEIRNCFEAEVTVVSNEFIDRCMAAANGEYVKVYLYVLRQQGKPLDVTVIADALNHTEADVRRALAYWEKAGVLETDMNRMGSASTAAQRQPVQPVPSGQTTQASQNMQTAQPVQTTQAAQTIQTAQAVQTVRQSPQTPVLTQTAAPQKNRPVYSQDQVNRLAGDEEFSQLLYIAQKYMNRIFTQRDVGVFAYLYDGLHMNAELLEYLVEHCVQGGHTSTRYIETVAISWHEKGFATAEEARAYAESFSKNTFSVMKAFGLTDRKPGEKEKEMIDRWFTSYGFTKELVLEACNRTMNATHSPSFQYAERILAGWKQEGVKTMRDVAELDQRYQAKNRTQVYTQKKPANQFHNFEQRDTNYDEMALEDVMSWIKK